MTKTPHVARRVWVEEYAFLSRPGEPEIQESLAPALVDGAYESDELPFALEVDEPAAPAKNANGRALGDLP